MLLNHGHEVGIRRKSLLFPVKMVSLENIDDTVTMYIGPQHQQEYYDYADLNPKRVLFNPAPKILSLKLWHKARGIDVEEACTLVLYYSLMGRILI